MIVSIIIPFHNEKEALPHLQNAFYKELSKSSESFEIIYINDGSTDGTNISIHQNTINNIEEKLILHRKKMGKGKALLTGFRHSKGEIIIFMDADLQDDPKDISRFIEKIQNGYDFVNGWRKKRNDPFAKTFPSSFFNFFLLRFFLKSKYHDINCGFKAMRRNILENIPLYGDNYRFLPLLAEKEGFNATEIEVAHHSRKYGVSKYGFFRLFSGFIDILGTYFVYRFSEKPLHFFWPVGAFLFSIGFLVTFYLIIERIFYGILLYKRPILLLGILLIIVGLQIVMTGFLGELIVYLNKKTSK